MTVASDAVLLLPRFESACAAEGSTPGREWGDAQSP
jgi:hypothetical protein